MSSAMIAFGERIDTAKIIGAALILLGMATNSWPERRTRPIEAK
jgi:drug/metabolite transporter (DMT)-like permease